MVNNWEYISARVDTARLTDYELNSKTPRGPQSSDRVLTKLHRPDPSCIALYLVDIQFIESKKF